MRRPAIQQDPSRTKEPVINRPKCGSPRRRDSGPEINGIWRRLATCVQPSRFHVDTPDSAELADGLPAQGQSLPFSATIRASKPPSTTGREGEPGRAEDEGDTRAAAGESWTIVNNLDRIAGAISHKIDQKPGTPLKAKDFGRTVSSTPPFSKVQIRRFLDIFFVNADLEHEIRWDTRKSVGPKGQVDIESDTDADITAANYRQVARDLRPDMTDLKGRPPRDYFWAKDLTRRHEIFHVIRHRKYAREGLLRAVAWLNSQSAATTADVHAHLATAHADFFADLKSRLENKREEKDAYKDGASRYRERSKQIRRRGRQGLYP